MNNYISTTDESISDIITSYSNMVFRIAMIQIKSKAHVEDVLL